MKIIILSAPALPPLAGDTPPAYSAVIDGTDQNPKANPYNPELGYNPANYSNTPTTPQPAPAPVVHQTVIVQGNGHGALAWCPQCKQNVRISKRLFS